MPLLRQEGAGRHPEQSSEALGAAACHPGPRAVAHGVVLNRECGVSATKIARLFGLFGLAITAGGMVGILHLAAQAAMPTCAALVEGVRNSEVVCPDETETGRGPQRPAVGLRGRSPGHSLGE
ncbi:MAG: hypothetical protein ACRDJK_08310 [Actinomycetota bacterium]